MFSSKHENTCGSKYGCHQNSNMDLSRALLAPSPFRKEQGNSCAPAHPLFRHRCFAAAELLLIFVDVIPVHLHTVRDDTNSILIFNGPSSILSIRGYCSGWNQIERFGAGLVAAPHMFYLSSRFCDSHNFAFLAGHLTRILGTLLSRRFSVLSIICLMQMVRSRSGSASPGRVHLSVRLTF